MSEVVKIDSQLDSLVSLFYSVPSALGEFEKLTVRQCPAVYQRLLAHSAHMTVTVELHHGHKVNVEILAEAETGNSYRRKIVLRRSSDHHAVQFGIVRLDLNCLTADARSQVLAGQTPLGRVLIENQILTEVHLRDLWRVQCGKELAQLFGVAVGTITYGRTARIHVAGKCCIELLEIVAPEPE